MSPRLVITISAVAVVIVIVFAFRIFNRASHTRAEPRNFESTDEMMKYLAEQAVRLAEANHHVKLDYSPASIEKVEEVLGKIHEEFARTRPTNGVNGLAMAFGAYIGEVIRRDETGAKWERDDLVGGEKSYPMHWRGGASYVCAWCFRRITNGDEDNVWHKYIAIKQQSWKKNPPLGETNASL